MAGICRIQQLVQQARATFTRPKNYSEELEKLRKIMSSLKHEDLNIDLSILERSWDYLPYVSDAPAAFMDVFENSELSVTVFMLKAKKRMPLHDHPGMLGLMKVLSGSMLITSYNAVNTATSPYVAQLCNQVLVSPVSDLCVLGPNDGNIHELEAQDEPVVFLDILTPPYDPEKGINCTYYTRETCQSEDKQPVLLKPCKQPSSFSCVPQPYTGPIV